MVRWTLCDFGAMREPREIVPTCLPPAHSSGRGVEFYFAVARYPLPRKDDVRSLATRVADAYRTPLPTLKSFLGKLVSLELLVS